MQDLVLIQDDVVIIQTSSSIYEDSRANFETDSGLKLECESADYNRSIGSFWLNGKAFQKMPSALFEAILDNVQTYIDVKEKREGAEREREEAKRIANMTDEDHAVEVRSQRDRLIAETDYLAMSDYPLSEEDRGIVTAYRQALRDVPTQEGFPREVVWPEAPAVFKRTKG